MRKQNIENSEDYKIKDYARKTESYEFQRRCNTIIIILNFENSSIKPIKKSQETPRETYLIANLIFFLIIKKYPLKKN